MVENGEGKSKFTNLLTKYVFINSFFFLENEADQKNKCFSYEHKVLKFEGKMVWSINQEEYQCDGEVGSSTKLNLRLIKSREKELFF